MKGGQHDIGYKANQCNGNPITIGPLRQCNVNISPYDWSSNAYEFSAGEGENWQCNGSVSPIYSNSPSVFYGVKNGFIL